MIVFMFAGPAQKGSVCEGETFKLACQGGEVIQVTDVLYGRTDAERCKDVGEIHVSPRYRESCWIIPSTSALHDSWHMS